MKTINLLFAATILLINTPTFASQDKTCESFLILPGSAGQINAGRNLSMEEQRAMYKSFETELHSKFVQLAIPRDGLMSSFKEAQFHLKRPYIAVGDNRGGVSFFRALNDKEFLDAQVQKIQHNNEALEKNSHLVPFGVQRPFSLNSIIKDISVSEDGKEYLLTSDSVVKVLTLTGLDYEVPYSHKTLKAAFADDYILILNEQHLRFVPKSLLLEKDPEVIKTGLSEIHSQSSFKDMALSEFQAHKVFLLESDQLQVLNSKLNSKQALPMNLEFPQKLNLGPTLGKSLAIISPNELEILNLDSMTSSNQILMDSIISDTKWSFDETLLAISSAQSGDVKIYNTYTKSLITLDQNLFKGSNARLYWNSDNYLITVSENQKKKWAIEIWNSETGQRLDAFYLEKSFDYEKAPFIVDIQGSLFSGSFRALVSTEDGKVFHISQSMALNLQMNLN